MVWKLEALPKIKFFIWALLKGKILTTENLQKIGINGPSRCPNCYGAEETMHHLFVDCPYAVDCWKKLSLIDNLPWNSQHSIGEVIHVWKKSCPWKNKRSNLVKRVWNTLPYTMLWSIWLARNQKTFKDKSSTTRIVCNKAKNLALETITVKTQSNIDVAMYSVEERSFISYILDKNNSTQKGNIVKDQCSQETHSWKIRLKEEEFANWLQKCNNYYLFFDRASKSNPGIAGAGGLILNANGECVLYYEWGLGNLSNNRAEALALY